MMRDPEAWISMIATPSSTTRKATFDHSFDPNPVLFPATWPPLKLLQMLAVAEALSSSRLATKYAKGNWKSTLVKEFLVQTALADEWHRVFLTEHRVVLGTVAVMFYLVSSLWLVLYSMTRMDAVGAVLMVPQLLGVVISAWMTGIICMDRHYLDEEGKRPLSILDFVQKQTEPLKVIQWYPQYQYPKKPVD
jgi:tryptophan-rich sensory protein